MASTLHRMLNSPYMIQNYRTITPKKFCTGNVKPKFEGGERNFFPVDKKVEPPPYSLSQRTKACIALGLLIICPAAFLIITNISKAEKPKKKKTPTI